MRFTLIFMALRLRRFQLVEVSPSIGPQLVRFWSSRGRRRSVPDGSSLVVNSHNSIMDSGSTSHDGEVSGLSPLHIYPYGTPESQLRDYAHTKIVHVIRHAQGTHNVERNYHSIDQLDARLTDKGKAQCLALAERIATSGSDLNERLRGVELVVSSPMTRCLQTTLLSLDALLTQPTSGSTSQPKVILAHEHIRETVNFNCDRRRPISEISQDFGPKVDFSLIEHDHDAIWESYEQRFGDWQDCTEHRESGEIYRVADRSKRFLQWLQHRDERHVVMCSHAAFLRAFFNYGHDHPEQFSVKQLWDDRPHAEHKPVFQYFGRDDEIRQLRAEFENCELRSFVLAFAS